MINLSGDKNELKPDDNSGFDASFGYRQKPSQSQTVVSKLKEHSRILITE
jgi:hypothetical protein